MWIIYFSNIPGASVAPALQVLCSTSVHGERCVHLGMLYKGLDPALERTMLSALQALVRPSVCEAAPLWRSQVVLHYSLTLIVN